MGIIFDERCGFVEHTNQVVATSRGRLPMLRYIAHVSKGVNQSTMLMLYKSLVRSVIKYGGAVYTDGNSKNMKKLQIIQNAGIRIAMGYRITTPTNVMHAEAGIMDVVTRMELLLERYTTKNRDGGQECLVTGMVNSWNRVIGLPESKLSNLMLNYRKNRET